MKFVTFALLSALALSGCGKSAQDQLAEAQLKALQDAQAQAAEGQQKKEATQKAITGGDGPRAFNSK